MKLLRTLRAEMTLLRALQVAMTLLRPFQAQRRAQQCRPAVFTLSGGRSGATTVVFLAMPWS